MRSLLLPLSLLLTLTACMDPTASVTAGNNPPAPLGGPDGHILDNLGDADAQPAPGGGSGEVLGNGRGNGGGAGGGGAPVPEPGTMLLVATGLASAALLRRRKVQPRG